MGYLKSKFIDISGLISKGHERSVKAKKNIFSMFFIKGVTISISLLYVPLLIKTLDTYNYGLWLTITSVFAWLNLFDIGLGNGLRNKLTEALSQNDHAKAKIYISTAYAAITVICILIALSFILVSPHINWSQVLNAPVDMNEQLTKLINVIFILYSLQFILLLVNSILLAFQMPAFSSMIIMFGQILSFILVFLAVFFTTHKSLLDIGTIISLSPLIVLIAFTFYLFSKKFKEYRPGFKYIQPRYLKDILGLGIKFFALQLITIIFYQTSNIIIAHNIGQEGVTEYNIAYKYIGLISMIFAIVITPFWSAATDAYSRGDNEWIKVSIKKLKKIRLLLSIIGFGMLFISKFVYKLWLGKTVEADCTILCLILIYFILYMSYISYVYILNGIGKVKLQIAATIILAAIYLPLAFFLSKYFGLTGILTAMIFVSLMNSIWSRIQFMKVISGKATGIWNK